MRKWTSTHLLIVFMVFSYEAGAALLLVGREVTVDVEFANPNDFSSAFIHVNHSITQSAGTAGQTGAFTYNLTGGPVYDVTVTGDAHIEISSLSISPTQATFIRKSIDGITGKFAVDYFRATNTGNPLKTGVVNGFNILELSVNTAGNLLDGAPYTFNIDIPGDWSASGGSSGNHTLLGINPLWTIEKDFVFSGGVTTFAGYTDSYVNDGLHTPQVHFLLIGSATAIPEPVSFALVTVGLVGLVFTRRKQA